MRNAVSEAGQQVEHHADTGVVDPQIVAQPDDLSDQRCDLRTEYPFTAALVPSHRVAQPRPHQPVDEGRVDPATGGCLEIVRLPIQEGCFSKSLSRRLNSHKQNLLVAWVCLYPRLNEIMKCRRSVTPDTALRPSRVLGMSADFSLGLQQDWDHRHAMNSPEVKQIDRLKPIQRSGIEL